MRNVAVIGAGVSPFGRLDKLLYQEIGRPVVNDAITDAGVERKLIQSCYCGTCGGVGVAHEIMDETGLIGIPITMVVNACSSGSNAFRLAYMDIASGMSDCVIAMGIEKMKNVSMLVVGGGTRFQIEDLANIVVKSRKNASHNSKAEFQEPMTTNEVINDVMINDPLTKSQCCPRTDGAAAVILMSEDWVKKYKIESPIWIKGSAMGSHLGGGDPSYPPGISTDAETAKKVFKMAGVEPKDFYLRGFGECHDCFSISELVHYEDFGFCKKGEGGKLINDGVVEIDGNLPVNPSGGLLSCGHPLGATGIRQISEILFQMRKGKEVNKRQVPDEHLDLAFTHTLGQPGFGFTNVMHVFSRDLKI